MATRILIAEDEEGIRMMLSRYLSREGFTVATASDGQEAIECLMARDFDVLLLDLMMPRVTGFGVLDFLGQSGRPLIRHTIVATAFVPPASSPALDSVCRVIRKPFELATLLEAVHACKAA